MRQYKLNVNYFNKIDSHEKAYVLGFLYADGSNRGDGLSFTQDVERIDILENIKKALESESPIRELGPRHYIFEVFSNIIVRDVEKLGVVKNKSLVLQFPTKEIVPDKFMSSFILGYFDGDGCIWNGKRKKMIVKDSKRKNGYRERIVHNVKFTFTGCVSFIEPLQNYLVSKGIVKKKTKLNYSKAKNPSNSTCDKVCTMEYSGRGQIRNLYEYMYSKSPIWCNEKKLKFEEIFCALDEKSSIETVLIEETAEMPIVNQGSIIEKGSSTIPEMGVESSDSKCTAPNESCRGCEIVSSHTNKEV